MCFASHLLSPRSHPFFYGELNVATKVRIANNGLIWAGFFSGIPGWTMTGLKVCGTRKGPTSLATYD